MVFFKKKKPYLKLNLPPLEQESKDSNRRYLPRWETNNKILYRRANEVIYREARSKDISATGVCLSTPDNIAPRESLNMVIYLAQDHTPLSIRGKTVWRKSCEAGNLIGIQFENSNDKISELIFNFAFEFKRDELSKRWFKGT